MPKFIKNELKSDSDLKVESKSNAKLMEKLKNMVLILNKTLINFVHAFLLTLK